MSETVLVNFFIDDHLFDIAKSLCKKNKNKYKFSFCHRFPDKNFSQFDHLNFIDATLLYDVNNFRIAFKDLVPLSLSTKEYDFLLSGFRYVINCFDRMSPYPHRVDFYDEYFWELATYYKSFFKNNSKIMNIIFDQTPHAPWDLTLFFVAKMLKIKILILKRTNISGVAYIIEDFRDEVGTFQFQYQKFFKNINFKKKREEILLDLKKKNFTALQTNGQWIFIEPRIKLPEIIRKSLFYIILSDLYRFIRSFYEEIPNQEVGAFKKKNNSKFSIGKKLSRVDYIKFISGYLLRRFQNTLYDKNLEIFENENKENNKYIFFALHFQPERSTLPDGLLFANQIIAIKMLSQNIPDNFKIYVKEHPKQMAFDLRNDRYRSFDFYKKLKDIKNVRLLGSKSNYDNLIKNSFCTATITGSITWDGLLQGKPGIIFTNSYLAKCNSVEVVKNNNDVAKVLKNFKKKNQDTIFNDVINFLKKNQKYLIDAVIFSTHKHLISPKKYAEYLDNLNSSINQRLI